MNPVVIRTIAAVAGGLALLTVGLVLVNFPDSTTPTIANGESETVTGDEPGSSASAAPVERRTEAPRVTGGEAGLSEPVAHSRGRLVVLDIDTVSPVADLELWMREWETEFSSVTDRDGRSWVPTGKWVIDPQGDWEVVGSMSVEIRPGAESVLWVARTSDIEITVVDLDGTPVRDAELSLFALADSGAQISSPLPASSNAIQRVRTDSSGVGHLTRVPARGCLLVVRKANFSPATQRLFGDGEFTVVLTPCSAGQRRVQIVDTLDGSPVVGAIGRTTLGLVTTPSGSDGSLVLPDCAAERERFTFLCENYYPTNSMAISDVPPVLELTPASTLEVHISGIDPSNTTRMLIDSGLGETAIKALGNNLVAMDARPVQVVQVPSNREVKIQVLSSDGRSAQAELLTTTSRSRIDLALVEGSVLEVVVTAKPKDGGSRNLCSVLVEFPEPFGDLRLDGGSEFRVPQPDLAHRLEVRAPGCSPVRLAPLENWDGELAGSLNVELRAETTLSCTVMNNLGKTMPGVAVAVRSQVSRQAFIQFPELHGDLPTDHPGWVQSTPPIAIAITGAEGTAHVSGLTFGANRIDINPPQFAIAGGFNSGAWAARHEFTASGIPLDITLMMSQPKNVVIEAFDRYTGQGINRFRVSNRHMRTTAPPSSYRWSGLVPVAFSSLEVSAPGYTGESIALEGSEDQSFRVEMQPIDGMRVRIESALGVAATEFTIRVAFGQQSMSAFLPRWSKQLEAGVDSPGDLYAPTGVGTELRILEVRSEGTLFSPSIDSFFWAPGGEVTVLVRPVPVSGD